ncbi:hypothetical protein [Flagellimonas nanhaiensis]|uniref:Uncharacterized protein n=1 Tax=Flagellimonas nanhaiensis TaxID=2292706 RepID=A0A371JRP1_9FLAO|nr:hypothetical protein [Allomuricauda nanhaiensis]RDY60179.1 hypothetical protein DX873_12685 [Allomuricauda nanhaiensis]
MQILTIIWALLCASIIIGYPILLFNQSASILETTKKLKTKLNVSNVELISFDIRNQLPSWSLCVDVPEITEEVLLTNPILFYLESDNTYLHLPLNNASLGYTANVYKNIGKVYVTFKSLKDGVSNFYVPAWHLSKLKVLIINTKNNTSDIDGNCNTRKSRIYRALQNANININDYEDVLGYFSNVSHIDFKGHFNSVSPQKMNSKEALFFHKKHSLPSIP